MKMYTEGGTMVKSNKKGKRVCIICGATNDLKIHPSFGKSGESLCANCYRIANDNIP